MEASAAEALYPVRADLPWAEEDGAVVVLLPKRLDPFSRRVRALMRGPAHLRVPLDAVGSQAFRLADGTRTAGSLAAALVGEFGERAGPPDRALAFLGVLARNGILQLATQPTPAPEPRQSLVRRLACDRCDKAFHVADPPGARLRCPACGRQTLG